MPELLAGVPSSEQDARPGIPVIPVEGNHEYGGSGTHWFDDYFAPPEPTGVSGYDDKFFAFSYGNVRIIAVDTASAEDVRYDPGSFDPPVEPSVQYTWLDAELHSEEFTEAAWQIVYLHNPIYTSCSGHGERDEPVINDSLAAMFETHGVDLVFSGHNHIYERYSHNGVTYIIAGGGGADSHSLVEDTAEPLRQNGAEGLGYCAVDVQKRIAGEETFWDLTLSVYVDAEADGDSQLLETVSLQQEPYSTVVMLPDTQYYSEDDPSGLKDIFMDQTQWVANQINDLEDPPEPLEELNIAFLTHIGDVVNTGNNDTQWENADAAMATLDGDVPSLPYGVLAGNHDFDCTGTSPNSSRTTRCASAPRAMRIGKSAVGRVTATRRMLTSTVLTTTRSSPPSSSTVRNSTSSSF
ncbi:MAG: hypothetical protein A2V70_17005 [Planctomycetes bacterium RBG_13_63_9]|nr:MAG: hypothetical protein A2V70_17005 [Planctomycetes bacterium RBG_13_63_9]